MEEIIIHRMKQFESGCLFGLNDFIDGNKISSIKSGETQKIRVKPGVHSVHVEQGHSVSNSVVVDTRYSESSEIEVGTWLYGWKTMFTLFFILTMGNLYYARLVVATKGNVE